MAERRTRGIYGEDTLVHGRHALPKGTIVEQVAGTVRAILEAVYGLDLGQIWTWAQYKVCYVDNALQL
jgi:hypothetical protein